MKSENIKKHVQDYYHSQSLSEDKLKMLMELSQKSTENASAAQIGNNVHKISAFIGQQRYALVASLVLILVSFWGMTNFKQNQTFHQNLTQVVAQEIALNHSKQLDLDFDKQDYESLGKVMTKLDFTIFKSNHINLAGLNIVGARYCSIQGNIAAQIRLRNQNGKYFTLYETKLPKLLEKNPANIQRVGQIEVKQWQENHLFFGLAESIE